jgi:hypothetical protein
MKAFGYSRDEKGNPVVREGDVRKEKKFYVEEDGYCECEEARKRGVITMGCWIPLPTCGKIKVHSHTDSDLE